MTIRHMANTTINTKPLLAWLSQSSLSQGDFTKVDLHKSSKGSSSLSIAFRLYNPSSRILNYTSLRFPTKPLSFYFHITLSTATWPSSFGLSHIHTED